MAIRKTGDAGSRPQTAEENEVHTTPQDGLTAEVDPQDPQGLSKSAMASLKRGIDDVEQGRTSRRDQESL